MRTVKHIVLSLLFCPIIATAVVQTSLAGPATRVMDAYLTAQSALARDSMKNLSASAQALAEAVRADETKSFSVAIAEQAEALANAKTLAKARRAFEPLSESLIAYLKARNEHLPPGTYFEFYCPLAKARWLQTGAKAKNPYLGLRAQTSTWGWTCAGVVKAKFETPSPDKG